MLSELDDQNNILTNYAHSTIRSDNVLGVQYTSQAVAKNMSNVSGKFYFLKDSIGSVRHIGSESGQISQTLNYSSFGSIASVQNGSNVDVTANPVHEINYAFAGREYERELDMYYNRARYYDPTVGRFIQQDPDPGSLRLPVTATNRYIYGNNNPQSFTDPNGKFWVPLLFIVAAGALNVYVNLGNDKGISVWESFFTGAAGAGVGLLTGGTGLFSLYVAAALSTATTVIGDQVFSDTGFAGLFTSNFGTNLVIDTVVGGFVGGRAATVGGGRYLTSTLGKAYKAISSALLSSALNKYFTSGLDALQRFEDDFKKTPGYECDNYNTLCYE